MKWMFALLLALGSVTLLASELEQDKIYLEPGQIWIGKESIYISWLGSLSPVNAVHVDSQGVYTLRGDIVDQHTFSYTCPLGHASLDGSGRCNYAGCPFQKKK